MSLKWMNWLGLSLYYVCVTCVDDFCSRPIGWVKLVIVVRDLIVVVNRDTGGILGWMLGNVIRQVTDACTAPLLVVKDQKYCEA